MDGELLEKRAHKLSCGFHNGARPLLQRHKPWTDVLHSSCNSSFPMIIISPMSREGKNTSEFLAQFPFLADSWDYFWWRVKIRKAKGVREKKRKKGWRHLSAFCLFVHVCMCVLRKFDKQKNKNGWILLPSRPTIFLLAVLGVEEEPLEFVSYYPWVH